MARRRKRCKVFGLPRWIYDPIGWLRLQRSRALRHPLIRFVGFFIGLSILLCRGLAHLIPKPTPAYPEGVDPTDAASFYASGAYDRWGLEVLASQRRAYGKNFCVICRREEGPFEPDHIKPRSTHPELALDPDNGQVLCRRHNRAKSNRYEEDWR